MKVMHTEAIALLSGEFCFSSTIDAIDSLDDVLECSPNGFFGIAASSKNGSGACFWSFAICLFTLVKKLSNPCPSLRVSIDAALDRVK